ncbi:TasA family protein, partial [Arthrobacter terricola]
VNIALGTTAATNRLNVAATGIVPGDTIQRAVTLSNAAGNQNLSAVTLTTAATTTSTKLDSDATNGLQVVVDRCSTGWVEAGTAPAYTYTCAGTTSIVLASHAVVGANMALANLSSLTAGNTDSLRVTMTLPATADNTFESLSSTVGFTFTGTQRTATDQ